MHVSRVWRAGRHRGAAVSGRAAPKTKGPSPVEQRLAEINPDELTPKVALELLYELRGLLED